MTSFIKTRLLKILPELSSRGVGLKPTSIGAEPHELYARVAVYVLLVVMGLLSGGAARRESVTIDEIAHTGAGVSYLQTLDMRMNLEHPPLSKVIAAVPLVLRRSHADYSHISWTFSEKGPFNQYLGEWVFGHWFLMTWNEPRTTLFWARVPMLLVTLFLGYVLYRLGTCLGGSSGGVLCLVAFVTTPAFLAFGPLVITDIVFTLFWILTIWQLPNMWHSPGRLQILKFGLALAGALLSKFSSGLLLFTLVAVAVTLRVRPVPGQPSEKSALGKWRRQAWFNIFKGVTCAALFVYVVYSILSWNQSTSSFDLFGKFPASPLLRRVLMPPWLYLQGLIGFAVSASSRPTYILGHSYPHGVWFYFPVIFMLKSQLAFLGLLLISAITAVFTKVKKGGSRWDFISQGRELHWRCIWVSLIIYVLACMLNRLDISIRHFTVAIALIILLLGPLPRMLQALGEFRPPLARVGRLAVYALALTCLISAVRAYPYFLPYINSLGMGKPGYMLVNDSNLDWDQSFPEVEVFVKRMELTEIRFDRYGFAEPNSSVPEALPWNCQLPAASDGGHWVVVSANNIADTRNCHWLMRYPHQSLAGGSMYAVALPQVIPPAGQQGGPPLPEDFHFLSGPALRFDVRAMFLECIREPDKLEPTYKRFIEMGQEAQKKR